MNERMNGRSLPRSLLPNEYIYYGSYATPAPGPLPGDTLLLHFSSSLFLLFLALPRSRSRRSRLVSLVPLKSPINIASVNSLRR